MRFLLVSLHCFVVAMLSESGEPFPLSPAYHHSSDDYYHHYSPYEHDDNHHQTHEDTYHHSPDCSLHEHDFHEQDPYYHHYHPLEPNELLIKATLHNRQHNYLANTPYRPITTNGAGVTAYPSYPNREQNRYYGGRYGNYNYLNGRRTQPNYQRKSVPPYQNYVAGGGTYF